MAHLNVTNIVYTGKNPDNFLSPIKFRIAFEIMKPLPGGKPQIFLTKLPPKLCSGNSFISETQKMRSSTRLSTPSTCQS